MTTGAISGTIAGLAGGLAIVLARMLILTKRPGFAQHVAARLLARTLETSRAPGAVLIAAYGALAGLLYGAFFVDGLTRAVLDEVYPIHMLLGGIAWGLLLWILSLSWTWRVVPTPTGGPALDRIRRAVVLDSLAVHVVYGLTLGGGMALIAAPGGPV